MAVVRGGKRRCASFCLAFGLAVFVIPSKGAAQDTTQARPPRIGRVVGIFDSDTGRPIESAEVTDRIGGGTARTKASGLIGMRAFSSQNDSAVVRVRKIGFADTTMLVMVGAKDTVPFQVFMRRMTALDSVIVNATVSEGLPFYLKDFEERLSDSKVTGAKTFTPAEFRKNDGRTLYDVLRTKGVGVKTLRCGRIGVYLDGVPYAPPDTAVGSAGVPADEVDHYDAAVYYTLAEMPQEFRRTGGGCGALLLYSRKK